MQSLSLASFSLFLMLFSVPSHAEGGEGGQTVAKRCDEAEKYR